MYEGIDDRLERAASGTRIADLPREALIDRLSGILSGTYILVGFQIPAISDITLLTAKLATDLLESYAFLSVEEVELCFELGARGQYGDFAGLNLRTFHRWLRIYKTSEARYRLVTRRETARAALPATTPGHQRACEDRLLQKAFATYRERPAAGTGADRRHARGEAGGDGPLREPRRASGATATGGLRFPGETAGDGMVAGTLFRPVDRQWSTNTRLMTRWSTTPHAARAIFATYSRTI